MHKKACLLLLSIAASTAAFAQSSYLPLGSEDYRTLDRMETLSGRLSDSLYLSSKPETRKNAVHFLEAQLSKDEDEIKRSKIDWYNMQQMISESGEWAASDSGAIDSKHPWFHTFYKKQYDYLHIQKKDFFLVLNPVISVTSLQQSSSPLIANAYKGPLLSNSHGLELRGSISNRLAFYTSFADNQEYVPNYWVSYTNKQQQAVPGADYYIITNKKGAYDYIQASGYIDFAAIKDHVNITFGSGKHFIGDGISSVFLTDFSASTPFLGITARVGGFNYQCLYLELTPQYDKTTGDGVLAHKYATIHYVSYNIARWLKAGFYDAVVFDRPNSYEISYLNPILLMTELNHFNGNGDKGLLGFDLKAIVAKHLQFYSQFALNEFKAKEFFGHNGWYQNKWALQLGGKYFDAFTVKNLDLQAELDVVRPYTYTAKDTLANYTNFNQPLADPLGNGFIKAIGVLNYQPAKNVYITIKGTYYIRGNDTGYVISNGNNIFQSYRNASSYYGVKLINGPQSHCMIASVNVSYQLRRNLFLDLGGSYRKYESDKGIYPLINSNGVVTGPETTNYIYFGIRLNAARRDYDFF